MHVFSRNCIIILKINPLFKNSFFLMNKKLKRINAQKNNILRVIYWAFGKSIHHLKMKIKTLIKFLEFLVSRN